MVDGQVQRHGAVAAVDVAEHVRRGDGGRAGVGGAVPGEAVAGHGGGVTAVAVVDGQVQGVDLGAAVVVEVAVLVVAADTVLGVVPGVAVASHHSLGLVDRVVDGQAEGSDAVTAVAAEGGVLIAATNGVCHVVPLVADAGLGLDRGADGLLDGEVQGHGAVAAVDILEGLAVGAGGGVRDLVPGVADAGSVVEAGGDRLVDGEVHRHGAVAAVQRLEGLGEVAAGIVVAAVPDEVVAGGSVKAGLNAVVDGEVQRDDGAAVLAGNGIGGSAELAGALVVGHTVDPGEAVAGHDGLHTAARRGDGQLEGGDAVAAVAARGGVAVVAALIVGHAVPLIAVAGGGGDGGRDRLLDGERQGHGAVAAVAAGELLAVGTRGGVLHIVPGVAAAGAHADGGIRGIVDNQVQRHGAVATFNGGVVLRVAAGGGVVGAVPDEVGAGSVVDLGLNAVVDGERQGHGAVAAAGELVHIGGSAQLTGALGVGHTVDPGVLVAGGDGIRRGKMAADGQVQRDGAVAGYVAYLYLVYVGRCVGALGVGAVVYPGEALAGLLLVNAGVDIVQRQVQRGGAVAAVDVGGAVDSEGRGLVDEAVPLIHAVAGDDGIIALTGVVDGEVKIGDTVASRGIGGVEVGDGGAEVVDLVPGELLADRGVEQALRALLDGEIQRQRAVAAHGIGTGEGVLQGVAALGDVLVLVPVHRVADHGNGVAAAAVTDGEVQRHRAVAVIGGLIYIGRSGGGSHGVGAVVPGELVADVDRGVASVDVEGEVGHQDAVAHGAYHQRVEGAHLVAEGVGPVDEVVARRRRGGQGVLVEVTRRTVGAGDGTTAVAVVHELGNEDVMVGVEVGTDGDGHGLGHSVGVGGVSGNLLEGRHGRYGTGKDSGLPVHEVVAGVGLGDETHRGVMRDDGEGGSAIGGDQGLHTVVGAEVGYASTVEVLRQRDTDALLHGEGVGHGVVEVLLAQVVDGIDGVGAGLHDAVASHAAGNRVTDDAGAVVDLQDGVVDHAVAHLDAVRVVKDGLPGVEVNQRVAGEGVGVPCQLGKGGVEEGDDGAVAGHRDRDGVVGAAGVAPALQVVAGIRRGHQDDGAVGHDGVGAVGIGLHEGLAVSHGKGAHHAVGSERQRVGDVQEVGHQVGVAHHGDGAHTVEGRGVVPAGEVVGRVGLRLDGELAAGLHDIGVEAQDAHAVGYGGHAGDGEAAVGGNNGGGAIERAVDVHVVLGLGILGDHAVATGDVTDGAFLVPVVREFVEVGDLDGLVTVHGVAGIAVEVHAAVALGGEGHHGIATEAGLDSEVAVKHIHGGNKVVGRGSVACPCHQVAVVVGDGKHLHGGVALHTVDIAVVLGQVHNAGGKLGSVLDGQLVDVDVLGAGAADDQGVAVDVNDGTIGVAVGGVDSAMVGSDGLGTVGTVGQVEGHLRDDVVARGNDGHGAGALDGDTIGGVGCVSNDGDATGREAGSADVVEDLSLVVDHELDIAVGLPVFQGQRGVVVEDGGEGAVARQLHGTRQRGHAVVPHHEVEAGIRRGADLVAQEVAGSAVGTGNGAHVSAVGVDHHGEVVVQGVEDRREDTVRGQGDGARVGLHAVGPHHEAVTAVGHGADLVLGEVARGAVGTGHAAEALALGVHIDHEDVVVGVIDGIDHAVAHGLDVEGLGNAEHMTDGVLPAHEVVARVGNGCQRQAVEVGDGVAAQDITGQSVGGQAADVVLVDGEAGLEGGVAHRREDEDIGVAHQHGIGVVPAGEGVAILGLDHEGVVQEVHVTASQAHGAHLLVGADDGTLVFLDGVGYIICIGVEAHTQRAVHGHRDTHGVIDGVHMAPAVDVVARVGGGNDAHRAVGHHDVAAGNGVGFHILLAGDGINAAHHAVGLEGQQVGVVQEVGLDLHVAVDVDHRSGNAAVEDEAVALGDFGPVDEVVVGVRGGREAQVGVGKHSVVVVGDVVVYAVGERGLAGDVEGTGRGDDGDDALEDAVHIEVVAGGVFGDFAVAALDLHDVAGLIPLVGQLDALGLDDAGTGDGVALVAGEVDRAHGHVAHGKGDDGVRGKGGGQGVVGLDGQLDGQGVEHSQAVGR